MVQFIKYTIAAIFGYIIGWYSQHWFISEGQQNYFIKNKASVSVKNEPDSDKVLKAAIEKNIAQKQPVQQAIEIESLDVSVHHRRSLPIFDDQFNEASSQINYQSNILYTSDDVESRLAAIDVLTGILASKYVAVGLGDIDVTVRIKSIEGLKIIASDNSIRYIGESLFTNNSLETKLAAINALSELSYHPYAQEFLLFSSVNDSNSKVRKAAANALDGYPIEN
jgi:hypothetical protein